MKQFVAHLILFLFAPVAVLLVVGFQNQWVSTVAHKTESNVAIVPKNQAFNQVFLGTSQGRTFSREKNYLTTDSILGENSYLNLCQGSGGGGFPALYSLDYFFDRDNSTKQIVYLISPWVFFSEMCNDKHTLTRREIFKPDFLWTLLTNPRTSTIEWKNYLYSPLSNDWEKKCTWRHAMADSSIGKLNEEVLANARAKMEGHARAGGFEKYKVVIDDLQTLAAENKAELIFVYPPFLMTDIPGKDVVDNYVKSKNLKVFDFSEEMQDPIYFYDHIHLNNNGVRHFLTHFLKPIL